MPWDRQGSSVCLHFFRDAVKTPVTRTLSSNDYIHTVLCGLSAAVSRTSLLVQSLEPWGRKLWNIVYFYVLAVTDIGKLYYVNLCRKHSPIRPLYLLLCSCLCFSWSVLSLFLCFVFSCVTVEADCVIKVTNWSHSLPLNSHINFACTFFPISTLEAILPIFKIVEFFFELWILPLNWSILLF